MKKISKTTLHEIASTLMFDMEDAQYDTLIDEFDVVLKQMDLISQIPGVDEVEPMTFPFEVTVSYLREDEATTPTSREEALKNAKEVVDGQIRLPKVVG